MEFMGFQKCKDFLVGFGIVIAAFISDRHTQIASHMKNVLSHITHYFDLWHLKKSMIINNYYSVEYCLHCYFCILLSKERAETLHSSLYYWQILSLALAIN